MIAMLKGRLERLLQDSVIINCNGVGYGVHIPNLICQKLGDIDSEVNLEIFTYMKENILELYGFNNRTEKEVFITLLSVSGIGPKAAMAILGKFPANDVISFVKNNDTISLTQVSGIGQKAAERLCLELNKKIDKIFTGDFIPTESSSESVCKNSSRDEAISALVNLGYRRIQAQDGVDSSIRELGSDAITADLIKTAFKHIK